ncbi:MAG: endonuclease/exonuclease/phosphatase family protein [Planctomycetota bacterium]
MSPFRWLPVVLFGMLASASWAQEPPSDASAAPATQPAKQAVDRPPIRVVAWNIEWLGTPDRRFNEARGQAQDPAELARELAKLRPDVIALQEIRAEGSLDDDPDHESPEVQAMLDALGREFGGTWEQVMFPTHGRWSLVTGLAWNTERVQAVGGWKRIHPQLGPDADPDAFIRTAGPRPSHGQKFTTGEGLTDFVVVPIHWRSSFSRDTSPQRAEEAAELVAGLPVVFDDPDVIVIGDANTMMKDEPALGVMADAGFRDLNARHSPTHIANLFLDRAFVPADQPEFRAASFRVVDVPEKRRLDFHKRLSDHYPLVVAFPVAADDD